LHGWGLFKGQEISSPSCPAIGTHEPEQLLSAQHLVADTNPRVERAKMRVARSFIIKILKVVSRISGILQENQIDLT
jgi:hypothetical protein